MANLPCSGTLKVGPLIAEIIKTDFTAESDCFCKIILGNHFYRTGICKGCGRKPKWDDKFEIFISEKDKSMLIELWEHSLEFSEEIIGKVNIYLSELHILNQSIENWFDIKIETNIFGRIQIKIELEEGEKQKNQTEPQKEIQTAWNL
ncbi:unnamed protein product [Blepharisma stoltei]|uniref:C2 domain-containing protein n=1 Tax=Blepharisma stoltei TaxID=1481888 RepID=A0AAU9IDX0_9CILI|nr:unnamed protein product [Blepharisma stoltei]